MKSVMQTSRNKRIFDATDLIKMFEAKILSGAECLELVEGEILERNDLVTDEDKKSQQIAEVLNLEFGKEAVIEVKPLIQIL